MNKKSNAKLREVKNVNQKEKRNEVKRTSKTTLEIGKFYWCSSQLNFLCTSSLLERDVYLSGSQKYCSDYIGSMSIVPAYTNSSVGPRL